MKNSSVSVKSLQEVWNPYGKLIVAVLSIGFIALEAVQSFPYNVPLRQSTRPMQNFIDDIGLYGRGWGMFAGTNTNTSTVTLVLHYRDGSSERVPYLTLHPGYKRTAWSEVMQDLQFDDNNDRQGVYKQGFLTYTCSHPPVGTTLPSHLTLEQERIYYSITEPAQHSSTTATIGFTTCAQ
jgi:hypothetical protein